MIRLLRQVNQWKLLIVWILATSMGWVMGQAINSYLVGIVALILPGIILGASQWLILRHYLSKAGWWILATSVGQYAGWSILRISGLTVNRVESWIVFGIIFGALTGINLCWLLPFRKVFK